MYDKYSKVSNITIGSKLPVHKGILLSNSNTSGVAGVSLAFYHGSVERGGTFATEINVGIGSSILPFEIYSITRSLPSGVTAFYLI